MCVWWWGSLRCPCQAPGLLLSGPSFFSWVFSPWTLGWPMTQPWAWREIPQAPGSGGGRWGLGEPWRRKGCRAGAVLSTSVPRGTGRREAHRRSSSFGPAQWSHCSPISCLGFPSLPCPSWEEAPGLSFVPGEGGMRVEGSSPPGPAAVTGAPHLWPVSEGTGSGL